MDKELKEKMGNKWLIFNKIHGLILSISPKIKYRIFPIYIRYCSGEDIVALVYFKGKFTSDSGLDVGFAFKEKPKNSGLVKASHMKYPGINYSVKINRQDKITKELIKTIKSITCQ